VIGEKKSEEGGEWVGPALVQNWKNEVGQGQEEKGHVSRGKV
jgi:hypothetical protein